MASEKDTPEQETSEQQEKGNGSNGSNGSARKTVLTAAALAAATGATALAAKKVLSDRNEPRSRGGDGEGGGGGKQQGNESLVTSMVTSGWDAARDSILPLAEDAASRAGEFVATAAPEIVRDTLVPRFIEGFEQGRKQSDD